MTTICVWMYFSILRNVLLSLLRLSTLLIITDHFGSPHAGITAEAKINRTDYGLTCNRLLETGKAIVGNEIKISLDIEIVKK